MARIRDGGRGYVPLDDLHLENLHRVAEAFGVTAPDSLNAAWERLDPWPDVVPGLRALKAHHIIAPCSNGSIALMTRLAKYGGLPGTASWARSLPATTSRSRHVYLACCEALRLPRAR
jgi:2-haloacid dehalogenase